MLNDVWVKMAEFLGNLNGENVNRESYIHIPEYDKALAVWKETEQDWEDFASVQERRHTFRGNCVQVLFRMGLLKETEGLRWPEK